MSKMIVKIVVEVEVDGYDREQAIKKAETILEDALLPCRWDVQAVSFLNGHPVDSDYSDSPSYPGNSLGGIWGD